MRDLNIQLYDTTKVKSTLATIGYNYTYSLPKDFNLSGEGSEFFSINEKAEIRLEDARAIENQTNKTYSLKVGATNESNITSTSNLTIKVVQDSPTIYPLSLSVMDGSKGGYALGKIAYSIGNSNMVSFVLLGDGSSEFLIDKNGVIKIAPNVTLEYSRKKVYNLQAIATNSMGRKSKTADVKIVVYDDAPILQNTTLTTLEEVPAGEILGRVIVSTQGKGRIVSYEIYGEDAKEFTITDSGYIKVSQNGRLDFETKEVYTFKVKAKNAFDTSNEAKVRVVLIDIPDTSPSVISSQLYVSEDKAKGFKAGALRFNKGGGKITSFTLSGSGSEDFRVDANGSVWVHGALSHSRQSRYRLEAVAHNSFGASKKAKLTIHILKAFSPILKDTNLSVVENEPKGTMVGKVKIQSAGKTPIQSMSLSGVGAEKFSVDKNGTILLNESLDYEEKRNYYLLVDAKNANGISDKVNLTIKVLNVAEHTPILYEFKGFIEDNATKGAFVGDIKLASSGDSAVSGYRLSGDGAESFYVEQNGTVRVLDSSKLDEKVKKHYTLNFYAANEAGESNATQGTITLTYDKKVPNTPSNLSLEDIFYNSITLKWNDNSDNERGFNLYLNGIKVGSAEINATQYTFKNLQEETSYVLGVKAFNDRGESELVSIEGKTDIDRSEAFKAILKSKCGMYESSINSKFNQTTGHFNGHINCSRKNLTDKDILNFKALKSISGSLYLHNNQLTNVDGLSNLKSVGGEFYLNNNALTNVDGLSSLESVKSYFELHTNQLTNVNGLNKLKTVGYNLSLQSNKLTNVDGLSSLESVKYSLFLHANQLTNVNGLSKLKTVGQHLYLQSNKLENINGLTALTSVGNNFNLENNQLTNVDSLTNLLHVGGYVAIRNNPNLKDISGLSNIAGRNGQVLYITPNQYTTKANKALKFCQATWDLKDKNGDIGDDMSLVCGEGEELTDVQKLRKVLNEKCGVSFLKFEKNFQESSGIYNTSIDCSYKKMNDDHLNTFRLIAEIQGSLSLNDNNLTNLNGLSNITKIGKYFFMQNNNIDNINGLVNLRYIGESFDMSNNKIMTLDILGNFSFLGGELKIYKNSSLTDISGLASITAVAGKKLYIDTHGYTIKVGAAAPFCSATWDIYSASGNENDDMSKVCYGVVYNPSDTDKLRDMLGKRCSIDSATFYKNYVKSNGRYDGALECIGVEQDDVKDFKALLEINGNLSLQRSKMSDIDGLIFLKRVNGNLNLQDNPSLKSLYGASNIQGNQRSLLYLDSLSQYSKKADGSKSFCKTKWNIYENGVNIDDDMSSICIKLN